MLFALNRRSLLAAAAGASVGACATKGRAEGRPRNVLLIAVDDLRPIGAAFDQPWIMAPNMDRLAAGGVAFQRAYAQYAVCNPSRASLLTGPRPDATGIFDLNTHFRANIPAVVTLPQRFRAAGYETTGIGKVFHLPLDDPQSWSTPAWSPEREIEYREPGLRAQLEAANPDGTGDIIVDFDEATGTVLRTQSRGGRVRGPTWEAADVADEDLQDGRVATRAIAQLEAWRDRPFFLAVGFKKPHLPFIAPRRYFELYPDDAVPLAANAFRPLGLPDYEAHRAELPAYAGVPDDLDLSEEQRRELVRGYAAACTYVDAQLGRVLDALDHLGLADSTTVTLFGDHGYFLGENGFWAKHNNMEVATRAPLIVRAPGVVPAGVRTAALAELVDLYPTLCSLSGLAVPEGLEGVDLSPALAGGAVKAAAFSQYRRRGAMGRSIRTENFRYTEWREEASGALVAQVLFDHAVDPQENRNVAAEPAYGGAVVELSAQLHEGWRVASGQ